MAFVERLFAKITSDPEAPTIEEIDAVKNQKDSNWDSYFSGSRNITRFALKVAGYIDIPKFAAFVQKIGTDAKIQLVSELKPYCRGIKEENIGEKTAELFKKIILNAARRPRKNLKKTLSQNMLDCDLTVLQVEDDLRCVVNGLSLLRAEQIEKLKLTPVEIVNKIEEQNGLLLQKICSQVNTFYYRVGELFGQIGNIRGKKFKSVAFVIAGKYREMADGPLDQNRIFDSLVDWLNGAIPEASRIACEIVISFFIQNCEVFDELP